MFGLDQALCKRPYFDLFVIIRLGTTLPQTRGHFTVVEKKIEIPRMCRVLLYKTFENFVYSKRGEIHYILNNFSKRGVDLI